MEYVLGLDWIGGKVGWACAQLSQGLISGQTTEPTQDWVLSLRVLPFGAEDSELIKGASKIVLDAPIGLYGVEPEGCCLRGCDKAAKRWIGPELQSSVFPVPYQSELDVWRTRRTDGQKQRLGHFRGLLPAIHSADLIRKENPNTLESHPELVFAALLGKPLPAFSAKTTLFGACVRLGLTTKYLFKVPLGMFAGHGRIPSDNFIDALGMAIVATDWADGERIELLRDPDGSPQPLGDDPEDWPMTMALPRMGISPVGERLAAEEELTTIAMAWMHQET